jgi:hypothetical protein
MKFFESSSNNSQITTTSLSLYENNDLTLDTICCSTFDTNNISKEKTLCFVFISFFLFKIF